MHRPRVTQVRFFLPSFVLYKLQKNLTDYLSQNTKLSSKKPKFGKFHQKCGTVGQIAKMWDKCGTKLQNVGNVGMWDVCTAWFRSTERKENIPYMSVSPESAAICMLIVGRHEHTSQVNKSHGIATKQTVTVHLSANRSIPAVS